MLTFDGLVLAGGSGRRLGGVDKVGETVGGVALVDRALQALRGAGGVVVVGPQRPTARPARWVREVPPGGGPAAALVAGLAHVGAGIVVVLAADLPFAAPAVPRLLASLGTAGGRSADGVVLVDADGRPQPLLAAYRTPALRAAAGVERADLPAGGWSGRSLRELIAPLQLVEVAALGDEALDCDTPAALARARAVAGAGGTGAP